MITLEMNASKISNERMKFCQMLIRGASTIRVFTPLLKEGLASHARRLVEEPGTKPQLLLWTSPST